MKKIYLELTGDQKERGVIFSSSLSYHKQDGGKIHEVLGDNERKHQIIKNLLDDKFFNGSPFKYNIIRE